jgi:hypothetical protein
MVPKFDSFFTPYLKCLSDGNIHKNKDIIEYAFKGSTPISTKR